MYFCVDVFATTMINQAIKSIENHTCIKFKKSESSIPNVTLRVQFAIIFSSVKSRYVCKIVRCFRDKIGKENFTNFSNIHWSCPCFRVASSDDMQLSFIMMFSIMYLLNQHSNLRSKMSERNKLKMAILVRKSPSTYGSGLYIYIYME